MRDCTSHQMLYGILTGGGRGGDGLLPISSKRAALSLLEADPLATSGLRSLILLSFTTGGLTS